MIVSEAKVEVLPWCGGVMSKQKDGGSSEEEEDGRGLEILRKQQVTMKTL